MSPQSRHLRHNSDTAKGADQGISGSFQSAVTMQKAAGDCVSMRAEVISSITRSAKRCSRHELLPCVFGDDQPLRLLYRSVILLDEHKLKVF